MPDSLKELPLLGSGLGYRGELDGAIAQHASELDVLEVITERYLGPGRERLEALRERWPLIPLIPHGVSLSIGTFGPLDRDQLRQIREVSDTTRAPYYSDHLCFTRAPGIDLGHLTPLWFTESMLDNTIQRVNEVQDFLGKPLVLENVTYLFEIPNAGMPETEFFHRLVDATGCGILFDVTNLYTNSVNHGFDAEAFLSEMPLDHVVHAHIAGGFWKDGILVDSHSHLVPEEAWELLEFVIARSPLKTIILEHDSHFPEHFDTLLSQVARAQGLMTRGMAHRSSTSSIYEA